MRQTACAPPRLWASSPGGKKDPPSQAHRQDTAGAGVEGSGLGGAVPPDAGVVAAPLSLTKSSASGTFVSSSHREFRRPPSLDRPSRGRTAGSHGRSRAAATTMVSTRPAPDDVVERSPSTMLFRLCFECHCRTTAEKASNHQFWQLLDQRQAVDADPTRSGRNRSHNSCDANASSFRWLSLLSVHVVAGQLTPVVRTVRVRKRNVSWMKANRVGFTFAVCRFSW